MSGKRAVRQYHHKDLKGTLLRFAVDELRQYGPAQVSLRRIALRAGVSHAAPYRHFKSKDGLLSTLAWEGHILFTRSLRQARENGDPAPAERLLRLGTVYLEFARQRPEILELMFSETGTRVMQAHPPPDFEEGSGKYDSFGVLETTVRECQTEGTLDPQSDSGALALIIWSFVHGYSVIRREGFTASMGASRGYSDQATDDLVWSAFRRLMGGGVYRP